MKLNKRLIRELYENGNKAKESDLNFYYLWNSFVKLIEENKGENESLRQGMRNYLEAVSEDLEIDYEDSVLDVLYENPVFEDLRIEEGRDVYYYEYFNTSKQTRFNDDFTLSVKNFQRILSDSDMTAMIMSIFKVYDYMMRSQDDKYDEHTRRLIEAGNYLLNIILKDVE